MKTQILFLILALFTSSITQAMPESITLPILHGMKIIPCDQECVIPDLKEFGKKSEVKLTRGERGSFIYYNGSITTKMKLPNGNHAVFSLYVHRADGNKNEDSMYSLSVNASVKEGNTSKEKLLCYGTAAKTALMKDGKADLNVKIMLGCEIEGRHYRVYYAIDTAEQ